MLTKTWQRRIDTTGSRVRTGAFVVALIVCTVVALNTIWGWLFDDPIDVAGPARTAVNRTDLVGSFAQGCVTKLLTVTTKRRDTDTGGGNDDKEALQSLSDCWTLQGTIPLPTNQSTVVDNPRVAATTLESDTGSLQLWSVVVAVDERAYRGAPAHTKFYRLPVTYTKYGLHSPTLPGDADGPGNGADVPMTYRAKLTPTNPGYAVVAGFVTSYLTNSGGIERFASPTAAIIPVGGYRSVTVTDVSADKAIPDAKDPVPADGSKAHVLVRVSAVTNGYAVTPRDFPLTLTVVGGRWWVSAMDYAPQIDTSTDITPVIQPPAAQR
ncbi:hypothetical protein P5V34_11650 [Mycobacteroides abscessus subsp. abscessus]|uniref:hypothetical protein n=1 Tax=Mycobacteroides abscessus TaxID=36809 RepID=UPI00266DAECE|nr:hypothetical protein [Mycobacteroides abscessus]MDO3014641.1 hypothetical protein [Mycobacteroides abscessus subsp. abscessus]